jgi:hypothetical protein
MKKFTEEVAGLVIVLTLGTVMLDNGFIKTNSFGPIGYFAILIPLWLLALVIDGQRSKRHQKKLMEKTRPIPKADRYGQIRIEMSSKRRK